MAETASGGLGSQQPDRKAVRKSLFYNKLLETLLAGLVSSFR